MVAPDYDQLAPLDVPLDAAADCMANPEAPSIVRQRLLTQCAPENVPSAAKSRIKSSRHCAGPLMQ
jgi:hypothetical protein